MDIITKNIKSLLTLQRINACRLYLNITLLSEIGLANGKMIKTNILQGKHNSIESTTMWPQQRSPDKATWIMWRLILKRNFYSYDNNLQSNYHLWCWKCNSNQLRLKYRFLYSPALKNIYYKQGKTIINWFAKDERRTTITKNTDSQDFTTSIPADAHPIKHLNNDSFYIMRNNNQPTTITPSLSLIKYIASKPPWHRRIIENFTENTNVSTLLQYLLLKWELKIASDGSKTRTKSGGGWVIATKDGTIIVRGSNPDYGQIENIHSYRSEVYASLASQLFLKTYAEYFKIRIDCKITSYCDNKAYVERLK